jgi:hypothetical protein
MMLQMQTFPGTGVDGPHIANYMGVRQMVKREVFGATYVILIYGAYNAMGLIGSESNGIAILNETLKQVVTDQIACADSGWFGATKNQLREFDAIMNLSDEAFLKYLTITQNFRGDHTVGT